IRIALAYQPGLGYQRHERFRGVAEGWRWWNGFKRFHRELAGIGLATPLLQGHVHRPDGHWRPSRHGATHRPRQKALLGRRPNGLTTPAFDGQCGHALERRAHPHRTGFRRNDVEMFRTIEVAARVLHMHASDGRDVETLRL